MLDNGEWGKILSQGEFSTCNNGVSVVLVHQGIEYPVSCFNSKAFKRREVDGQLLQEIPAETISILIASETIPAAIPIEDYNKLTVVIDGEFFTVMFRTGTDIIRFYLKGSTEDGHDDSGNDVIVDDVIV